MIKRFVAPLFSFLLAATLLAAAPAVSANSSTNEMAPETGAAYLRGIQKALHDHGYDPGPVDGSMGPMTAQAIRDYQHDAGLPVDGVATKALLDHLSFAMPRVTANPSPARTQLVYEVQEELQLRGFYDGPIDGMAGDGTTEAVRRFQRAAGLPVTGQVDFNLLADVRNASPTVRVY